MSLLTQASLVVTPNANKSGKLYSVIPSNGNGDFTVTRATTATRTNSSGLIETTASGMVRRDYSLGSCPNLLLEPQRTNLALRSEEFDNAYWTKIQSIITPNTTTAPNGTLTADTFSGDGTSSGHFIRANQAVNSGTTYSLSFYAKKNTNNFIQVFYGLGFTNNDFANFDLNNGVIGTIGSSATASIINVGNGWYRCTVTATATSTAPNFTISSGLVTSATSLRAESNTLSTSVFLWGAQLEAGAYATSYIPTTSASVTRNADLIQRANIYTNGLITASGGTWFVELRNNISRTRDAFSQSLYLGQAAGGTGSNGMQILSGATGRLILEKAVAGTTSTLYTTTTDTVKIAIKWNGTTADVFVNGAKVVTATAYPVTITEFLVANGIDVPKNIKQMALFPTPLTDTQCTQLTTL